MTWPTIAAIIASCIGGFWGMLGASGLASRWRPTAFLAVLAMTTLLVTALPLLSPEVDPAQPFHVGIYGTVVLVEMLAIAALALPPLTLYRRMELFVPSLGLIVGLHFIGLGQAVGSRNSLLIAFVLCAISAAAFFVPEDQSPPSPRRLLVGFGSAVVLWLNAGATLI